MVTGDEVRADFILRPMRKICILCFGWGVGMSVGGWDRNYKFKALLICRMSLRQIQATSTLFKDQEVLAVNLIGNGINQLSSHRPHLGGIVLISLIVVGRPTLRVGGTFQPELSERKWEKEKTFAFACLPSGCAGRFIYFVGYLLLLPPQKLPFLVGISIGYFSLPRWIEPSKNFICLQTPDWAC